MLVFLRKFKEFDKLSKTVGLYVYDRYRSRLEAMPLGDLFPGTVDDFVPVTVGRCVGVVNPISHLQTSDHFIAGDAVPVVDDELKPDAL